MMVLVFGAFERIWNELAAYTIRFREIPNPLPLSEETVKSTSYDPRT